jgi:hypothetical protein
VAAAVVAGRGLDLTVVGVNVHHFDVSNLSG